MARAANSFKQLMVFKFGSIHSMHILCSLFKCYILYLQSHYHLRLKHTDAIVFMLQYVHT